MSPDLEIEPTETERTLVSQPSGRFSDQLEAALTLLQTGDFHQRWDAVKILSGLGESAVPPLVQLLLEEADTDWELLWFIARILGNLNSPAAVAALIQLLETTDQTDVVAMAVMALSQCGDAAIAPLTDLLAQPRTRLLAVQALAQISNPAVVPSLLTVVQDNSVDVRASALDALSHFYHATVTETFLAALTDPAAVVRQAAVTAIGLQASTQPAVDWVEILKPLLWDLNLNVCAHAAMACARIGSPTAIALLIQVLQSPPTPHALRLEIVRALAWIGNPAAVVALQQFLLNWTGADLLADRFTAQSTDATLTDSLLNQEIITALGRVTDRDSQLVAVGILLNLLQIHHPVAQTVEGRRQIALSLGQLQSADAIDPLIHLLADADVSVQFHVIAALKQFGLPAYQRLQFWQTQATAEPAALQTGIQVALQEWRIDP